MGSSVDICVPGSVNGNSDAIETYGEQSSHVVAVDLYILTL